MFWTHTKSSRKFIDLIYNATTKWANWDPSESYQAGDFGDIDKETGRFQKQGNIYVDNRTSHIAIQYPKEQGPPVDTYIASSERVHGLGLNAGAHADVVPAANISFQGKWKFNARRGALLAMYKPYMTKLPDLLLLDRRLSSMECLKDQKLITHVYSCRAYALYLSNHRGDSLNLVLRATAPVGPGVPAGPDAGLEWVSQDISVIYHHGSSETPVFHPLFVIKDTKKRGTRRGIPEDPNASPWEDIDSPWDLDDDGEFAKALQFPKDDEDSWVPKVGHTRG
ncbi:hypothetical protein EIP91_001294 [Steccherinum ochraceum]|uniref:Uncharacterized protein n=1 Tax=Steccherinum ochraceum TaxID=92696 RepID=A0A4R0RRQ2_9APHY|nr:hypothetical protein EIP91_001294 [Steccherinum ochraceum]